MDSLNLSSAFQSVKANHGCAGVDGVTIEQFESRLKQNLAALRVELEQDRYLPLPLMKIQVSKKNGEPRGLCIPVVRDRVVQKAALDRIEPILEKEFETCSFAYRKGRSVRQAVYKIKEYYDKGYQYVVDADIDAFFDNVDHGLLVKKFRQVVGDTKIQKLVELWIKAEVWDGDTLSIIEKGIPQGSAVSPILANLFLDELDEEMLQKGHKFIRYSDDFVILCKNPKDAQKALQLTKQILENLLLELDEEEIASFDNGFKFLGVVFLKSLIMKPFEVQQKKRKVLFYPGPFNLKAYMLKKKKG
jgi:group II intron reverse transcriptase/maturase